MQPIVVLSLLSRFRNAWQSRWLYKQAGSGLACALLICMLAAAISGCGNTSVSEATATAIVVSTTNGTGVKADTLAVSSALDLSMMPAGDKNGAGVDWTVTCAGNPVTGSLGNGACGTLAPAHTADGATTVYTAPSVSPIGGTITVTATVTSNPSQSSSVSFTIVALPIVVSLTGTAPSSLVVNTTAGLSAQVTNDPTGAGVFWTATCNSASVCGSFTSTQTLQTTYTAPTVVPTGGAVTLTATSLADTSKSASVTVQITEPPPPVLVTVSVSPSSVYAATTGSAHFVSVTALVANDPQAAGVDWSLSCGASSCGTLNGAAKAHTASGVSVTYASPSAVPPGGTVTITAASTTNPAVSASATATIVTTTPILVAISSAPPATLTGGSQATLAATVTGDTNNLGVNWTASCGSVGACGSFNLSPAHTASGGQIVYTAPASVPAGGIVTITASSPASTPSNSAVAFTTIVAQSPSLAFSQAPPTMMTAITTAAVSATVTNDLSPGGVNWTALCGSTVAGGCGWFVPAQTASGVSATYTAPPVTSAGTAVTIVATSVADPVVSISSTPIPINPATALSVSFVPSLPAEIQVNATVNLMAAVANDTANAGVDWQVCASGCGFFTVKPAIAAIPATTTTPYQPAVPAVTATSVSGWSSGLPIPYTAPSEVPASGTVVVEALAHADGSKAVSGTVAIGADALGGALSGVVMAGTQPVVGASVFLYSAGTSGYGSAAAQIAEVTTDKNGGFTVPARYTCLTPASQMYLVATGGAIGTQAANPNRSLMTALGSCNALGSSPVVVNEVTTVASAWATSPFAANDALTGNSSYLYLGTSSSNLAGLANAFAAVNNLVDITTGQARFTTLAANAAVPFVEINTLADALNACTATSGGVEGDGSPCSVLLTATTTLGTGAFNGAIAPSNTLQAAFNAAQQPVGNYGYTLDSGGLFGLATSASPFQPVLAADPGQWPISLHYTSGGGLTAASTVGSFAIDAGGNLWITDTTGGDLIEWNATGAAITSSRGYPAGGGPVAIDVNGNVWISGNGVLSELTSLGATVAGSPYAGVAGDGSDMVFDAQNDLWIANGGGVNEFNGFGVELSPVAGFTNSGISGISSIGIDSSNNLWIGNPNISASNQASFSELANPGGALIVDSDSAGGGTVLPGLAADGAGDIWGITTDDVICKVPPYNGLGPEFFSYASNCYNNFETQGGYSYLNAKSIALDGAGVVWVASVGGQAANSEVISPNILPIVLGRNSLPTGLNSATLAVGPLRVAVDGAGNIWVLLADNTVTEYVGVATPVVTPLALGIKNGKLAAKP